LSEANLVTWAKNLGFDKKGITPIKIQNKNLYFFEIKRPCLEKFSSLVQFSHPRKKVLLRSILNRKSKPGNKNPAGVTKKLILENLI